MHSLSTSRRHDSAFRAKAFVRAGFVALILLLGAYRAFSDTIFLKDGSDVKGIVVESFADRIILSTEYGETEIPKDEIKSIKYDLVEQNYVAIADKHMTSGSYDKALYYYERALQANPRFKEAISGVNYLRGYLMRKDLLKKADHVAWSQAVEDFSQQKQVVRESKVETLRRSLGLEIEERNDGDIVVLKVYSGRPAREAGMRRGDVISSIWGRLTKYMGKGEVTDELIKPEGMEIQIHIDRVIKLPRRTVTAAQVTLNFDGVLFENISEGTPAYRGGLRNGDMLLEVGGKAIRYTPLAKVQSSLARRSQKVLIRRAITIWRERERL